MPNSITTFIHPHFSFLKAKIPESISVRFEAFSDGWPRIFLESRDELQDWHIRYIADFSQVEDYFPQIAFLDGLLRSHIRRLDIILPFLPVASMERDTPGGELGIASIFCRSFWLLSERLSGWVHLYLYDIHDERELLYFPPSLHVHHHSLVRDFSENILRRIDTPMILFPDMGAKKAFSRYFPQREIVTCSKTRKSPHDIEIHFDGGVVSGRNIVIIDDHIRSWGTLLEAARAVSFHGASSVYGFVPHAVFPEGVPAWFFDAFSRFFTTDTLPKNHTRFEDHSSIEVFSFLQELL